MPAAAQLQMLRHVRDMEAAGTAHFKEASVTDVAKFPAGQTRTQPSWSAIQCPALPCPDVAQTPLPC